MLPWKDFLSNRENPEACEGCSFPFLELQDLKAPQLLPFSCCSCESQAGRTYVSQT